MTRPVFVLAVVVVGALCVARHALAQNPASATETTQVMNFTQLMQLAYTAENQLRAAQVQIEQTRYNMERLSRGDISALRDALYQAMTVQSMVSGFVASQESVAQRLQYSYPSPRELDGRFQTWEQYRQHMAQVEYENYRAYTEAARVLDKQLAEGLQEDSKLLNKLRDKASRAQTEAQQLQVTNLLLAELVRQMHMLRMEGMAAQRMQLLVSAAESQRRVAQETANTQLLKPLRMRPQSEYPSYSLGGVPR